MFVIFSLISVGFTLRRLNILSKEGNVLLTHLVLSVAVPATILLRMTAASYGRTNLYLGYVFLICILAFVLVGALAIIGSRLVSPKDSKDLGSLISVGMFGNVAFMGFPLVIALFGEDAMFYAVLFHLVCTLFAFSLGIKLLAGSDAKFSWYQLRTVLMGASLLAIVLFIFNIQIPPLIRTPLTHLSNMLTPIGMLLLGSILGGMNFREVLFGWQVYVIIAIKLLLGPVVVFLVLSLFVSDPMVLGVFVVLASGPTAPRTAALCIRYGGNQKLVSQGIFLSTIFSILTIPLLIHVLGL